MWHTYNFISFTIYTSQPNVYSSFQQCYLEHFNLDLLSWWANFFLSGSTFFMHCAVNHAIGWFLFKELCSPHFQTISLTAVNVWKLKSSQSQYEIQIIINDWPSSLGCRNVVDDFSAALWQICGSQFPKFI